MELSGSVSGNIASPDIPELVTGIWAYTSDALCRVWSRRGPRCETSNSLHPSYVTRSQPIVNLTRVTLVTSVGD